MAVVTRFDAELGMVVHEVTGDLRADEVLAAMGRLYKDPDHDRSVPVLWDARQAKATAATFDEILNMARGGRQLWDSMGDGRTAIVTSTVADFGMARMYQGLTEDIPRALEVFTSYHDAVAWLRLGRTP